MQQLSSGRRINRAADDAAGLAVATSLDVGVRSLVVARRNAETAQQAVRIADGGMAEIQAMLTRMRELAMHSASETVGDAERVFMQQEVSELLGAIDSMAWSTTFNEVPLLAQAHLDVAFVLDTSGSMGGELATLISSIADFRQAFIDAGVDVNFGLAAMRTSLDPVDGVNKVVDIGGAGFEGALASLPLAAGSIDAYSALVNVTGADDFNGDNDVFSWRSDVARHVVVITDVGQEAYLIPGNPPQTDVAAQLAGTGVVVHVVAPPNQAGGYTEITSQTGGSLHSLGDASGSGIPAALDAISSDLTGNGEVLAGDPITVQVGIHDTDNDRIVLGLAADATVVGLGLSGTTVNTRQDALDALDAIDDAIYAASNVRATIGAAERRLAHITRYQSDAIENETAAQARIEDLDFARASGDSAIARMLSEASTEMLAHHLDTKRRMVLGIYGQLGQGHGVRRGGRLNARM